MADSGGPGSWWKSFTNSSRKKGQESGGSSGAGAQPPPPPAQQPGSREPSPPSPDSQHPGLQGTAEPSRLDRPGGEKSGSSRRNLKISRSGRFKEKRKVRATLLPDGSKPPEDSDFPCASPDERP